MTYDAFIQSLDDKLRQYRRHLHRHPELSKQEFKTQQFIIDVLTQHGIEHVAAAKTGVVAYINSGKPGRCIAIRADIDALPLSEDTGLPFASEHNGVMHACGHDAHTAILLGTALTLNQHREQFNGSVKLFFQPNEEVSSGAKDLVREGFMSSPDVDAIIGLHVMPHLDVGTVELRHGALNASTTTVDITIHGTSSHAAYPQRGVDAILIAAEVISSLHTLSSRISAAHLPSVLSLGMINGGTKRNIIADTVRLKGTLRTTDDNEKERIKQHITTRTKGIAAAHGGSATIRLKDGYPPLINDPDLTDVLIDCATEVVGKDHLIYKDAPSMGAEDFGYYQTHAPGAFFHIGCRTPGVFDAPPLHSPKFVLDEDCLTVGVRMQVAFVMRMLEAS